MEDILFSATVPISRLDRITERGYEAVLCSLGYESRSREVAVHLAHTGIPISALGFPHGHRAAYPKNKRRLRELGVQIQELADKEAHDWIIEWIALLASEGARRVAIDISSMSRPRIAAAVHAVKTTASKDCVVDFLYLPERFEPPSSDPLITEAIEPISSDFAGWVIDARKPLAVIFGLGYEAARAAGALDYLEPALAIPFFPVGGDVRFVDAVGEVNRDVLTLKGVSTDLKQNYSIADPARCVAALDALVHDLHRVGGYRTLLLPFGPKIFALACLMTAASSDPEIAVWRVSPGSFQDEIDRQADDRLITLRVSRRPLEVDGPGAGLPEVEVSA